MTSQMPWRRLVAWWGGWRLYAACSVALLAGSVIDVAAPNRHRPMSAVGMMCFGAVAAFISGYLLRDAQHIREVDQEGD